MQWLSWAMLGGGGGRRTAPLTTGLTESCGRIEVRVICADLLPADSPFELIRSIFQSERQGRGSQVHQDSIWNPMSNL